MCSSAEHVISRRVIKYSQPLRARGHPIAWPVTFSPTDRSTCPLTAPSPTVLFVYYPVWDFSHVFVAVTLLRLTTLTDGKNVLYYISLCYVTDPVVLYINTNNYIFRRRIPYKFSVVLDTHYTEYLLRDRVIRWLMYRPHVRCRPIGFQNIGNHLYVYILNIWRHSAVRLLSVANDVVSVQREWYRLASELGFVVGYWVCGRLRPLVRCIS